MLKKSKPTVEKFKTFRKLRNEAGNLIAKIYKSRKDGKLYKATFADGINRGELVAYSE